MSCCCIAIGRRRHRRAGFCGFYLPFSNLTPLMRESWLATIWFRSHDDRVSRLGTIHQRDRHTNNHIATAYAALRTDVWRQKDYTYVIKALKARWAEGGVAPFILVESCVKTFICYVGFSFIDDVSLTTAVRRDAGLSDEQRDLAMNVEECMCPAGYSGEFCEACDYGYHRDLPGGGPHARCVACTCHGHSDTCDVDTG